MKKAKKFGGWLNRTAKKIANTAGAEDLVEYAGAKIAKAVAPKANKQYIKSNATAGQARKSAQNLATNVAMMAAGGAIGGTLRTVKAAKAAQAAKKVAEKVAPAKKVVAKQPKIKLWTNNKKGTTGGNMSKQLTRKIRNQDRYDYGQRKKKKR